MALLFYEPVEDGKYKVVLIHHQPESLPAEEREKGVEIEDFREDDFPTKFGHSMDYMINPETGEVWPEYRRRRLFPEERELVELSIRSDKNRIAADGFDGTTITASIDVDVLDYFGETHCAFIVDGKIVAYEEIADGQASCTISADEAGFLGVRAVIGSVESKQIVIQAGL